MPLHRERMKGCRDLRPLIRSRYKGVLKQDNEWKGELSPVNTAKFGGDWSHWSEFTAVFLWWIRRAASLESPALVNLYMERRPFTVQPIKRRMDNPGET